nr:MAG TPA_asm: Cytochrome b-c1 complex subunit 8 [Caudoviricetes sp.]
MIFHSFIPAKWAKVLFVKLNEDYFYTLSPHCQRTL